eukprot:TRINITY_DN30_c0_g1_i1.p1 TRINITY_DN30_c0_g1~~TRINITY_DN30_c0_g1_i1.p1  ORF type:complete len:194 (-),score=17.27 TRINITY_DN30_c0_g1_i1:373-954(-)
MHGDEERGSVPLASKDSNYPGQHRVKSGHTSLCARWIDSVLRIVTLLGTVAAFVIILKSRQNYVHASGRSIYRPAKWQYVDAFKFFLVTNIAVAAYSLLLALLTYFNKHGSLFLFFLDFIAASALMSAASAATAIAYIGYRGNDHLDWGERCQASAYRPFCRKIAGSLLASYIAWVALALSTLLVANRLRHRR